MTPDTDIGHTPTPEQQTQGIGHCALCCTLEQLERRDELRKAGKLPALPAGVKAVLEHETTQ